jgi:hypothetical protein
MLINCQSLRIMISTVSLFALLNFQISDYLSADDGERRKGGRTKVVRRNIMKCAILLQLRVGNLNWRDLIASWLENESFMELVHTK